MGFGETVDKGMRWLLRKGAKFLWVAAIATCFADTDRHVTTILAIGALAGTILGAMREQAQDERTGTAALLLDALLATPPDSPSHEGGLRLVADEASQSSTSDPHSSAV